MADKDFRVKNRLHVNGLSQTSGVILATNNALDAHTNVPTQYGGTGTTQSPNAGQVLFSSAGTNYVPTTLTSLDVKGATYSADAPSSPVVGQIWVESDTSSDSFDPNIIRRKTFTATANQTVFTTDVEFIQGYEQVFFNGMLLIRNSDYTTASNTNVTLATGAAAGDIVEVVSITNLNSINAATTTTNTFTGTQTIQTALPLSTSTALKIINDGPGENFELLRDRETGPIMRRYNGTYTSPTPVLANQRTGFVISSGYATDGYANSTAINFYAAEDQVPGAKGSYITFDTTNIGSAGRSEKIRIDSSGNVGIGTSFPTYKLHVNGGGLGVYAGSGRIMFNSNTQSLPASDDGGITNMPFGFAGNLSNGSAEMNIINAVNVTSTSDGAKGFTFVQKTGASTYEMPFRITGNGYLYQTDILGARETGLIRNYSVTHQSGNRGASVLFGMNDGSFAGMKVVNEASSSSGYNSQYISFVTHAGAISVAERMRINPNGAVIMGGIAIAQHLNEVLSVNHGANVQALVLRSVDGSYSTVQAVNRIVRPANSAYRFAQWDSGDGGDTEFYMRGDGQAYADGSWNGGGADYAEYFEWADGNPNNEDRRGYSVSLIENKIKIAEEGEIIIGVISGNPSVVGDHANMNWYNKYLKDDFGSYILDENGDRIPNPDYDDAQEYVSRENRPEWDIVGLMGKLRLRKGQVTGAGWIKMRDISETVEEWLVK